MEFVTLIIGTVLGAVAALYVNQSHSRLQRTLSLADEFNSREMLKSRQSVWTQAKSIFDAGRFDELWPQIPPAELEGHVLFHFTCIAWFFRKVAYLHRLKQIDETECRSLLGAQFEMFWTHLVARATDGSRPDDTHALLWQDLESLRWLRDGYDSSHVATSVFGDEDES